MLLVFKYAKHRPGLVVARMCYVQLGQSRMYTYVVQIEDMEG